MTHRELYITRLSCPHHAHCIVEDDATVQWGSFSLLRPSRSDRSTLFGPYGSPWPGPTFEIEIENRIRSPFLCGSVTFNRGRARSSVVESFIPAFKPRSRSSSCETAYRTLALSVSILSVLPSALFHSTLCFVPLVWPLKTRVPSARNLAQPSATRPDVIQHLATRLLHIPRCHVST